MAENFNHVHKGDPVLIGTETWNVLLDAGKDFRRRQPRSSAESAIDGDWRNLIKIKNTTGSDIARFGVLGLDGALITPDDNEDEFVARILLKGKSPTYPGCIGKFAVCREPIKDGEIGRAWILGDCPAKVLINDTAHQYAEVLDGDKTQLQSVPTGTVQILYMPSGASSGGASKCYVRLGIAPPRLVIDLDEDIAAGASGNGTIQTHSSSGYTDSSLTGVPVYNHRPSSGTLTDGTRVEAMLEIESGLLVITEAYKCMEP